MYVEPYAVSRFFCRRLRLNSTAANLRYRKGGQSSDITAKRQLFDKSPERGTI